MDQAKEIVLDQAFPRFLKFWRAVHKLSQEELAERLESSPRHISRMENGSSRPSEAMVLEISRVLSLGSRDSNHLLISAGFAALERKIDFHTPELKWLRKAMTMTLRALDPYPTALLDRSSNILMINRGWLGFYGQAISQQNLQQASNYFDFLFSSEGAGNIFSNREDTLAVILMSLTQQSLFSGSDNDKALASRLAKHPNVPKDWQQRAAKLEPMASFRVQIEIGGNLHRFFNVGSTVGALGPTTYASEPNLSIQTLYPEDEAFDLAAFVDKGLKHPLLFY